MSKETIPLSTAVCRSRALVAGGVSTVEIVDYFKQWKHSHSSINKKKNQSSIEWISKLIVSLEDALEFGASAGIILKSAYPLIRNQERLEKKLTGLKSQFSLQGAVAIVLPWGVAAFFGSFSLNFFMMAGIILQILGCILFLRILQNILKSSNKEADWLLEFLTMLWLKTLAGFSLSQAMERTLSVTRRDSIQKQWVLWLRACNSGSLNLNENQFKWPKWLPESSNLSEILQALLHKGSPCNEVLSQCIEVNSEERLAGVEERLNSAPTKISLVFCLFFTPALFLILMGVLWPTLSTIM